MTSTDARVQEIRERLKARTQGNWYLDRIFPEVKCEGEILLISASKNAHDMHFVAHAPSDLEFLLTELNRWDELHKTIEELEGREINRINKPLSIAAGYALLQMALKGFQAKVAQAEARERSLLARLEEFGVYGTDACRGCEHGRLTLYSKGALCVECRNKAQKPPEDA